MLLSRVSAYIDSCFVLVPIRIESSTLVLQEPCSTNCAKDIMDGQSLHSSVSEYESGYISPDPSLSCLPKQWRGSDLLLFELQMSPLIYLHNIHLLPTILLTLPYYYPNPSFEQTDNEITLAR